MREQVGHIFFLTFNFRCHSWCLTCVPHREFVKPPNDRRSYPTDSLFSAFIETNDNLYCTVLKSRGAGGIVGADNQGMLFRLPALQEMRLNYKILYFL